MLDIKFVKENLAAVQEMLKNRQNKTSLDGFEQLEEKRRAILAEVEALDLTAKVAVDVDVGVAVIDLAELDLL